MNSIINAGIVGCTMTEEYFQYIANASPEKINYKKTLFSGVASSSKFAGLEVVDDLESILDDKDISLILLSDNHLHCYPRVSQSGKAVRVVRSFRDTKNIPFSSGYAG